MRTCRRRLSLGIGCTRSVNDVNQSIGLTEIVEELVPETPTGRGARHKTRAVDQLYRNEPLAIDTPRVPRLVLNPQFSTDARSPEIGDSTIRLDSRERVIGYSDDRQSRSTEEGTLASVRLTYYPDLHLTPQNTFSSSTAHQ